MSKDDSFFFDVIGHTFCEADWMISSPPTVVAFDGQPDREKQSIGDGILIRTCGAGYLLVYRFAQLSKEATLSYSTVAMIFKGQVNSTHCDEK